MVTVFRSTTNHISLKYKGPDYCSVGFGHIYLRYKANAPFTFVSYGGVQAESNADIICIDFHPFLYGDMRSVKYYREFCDLQLPSGLRSTSGAMGKTIRNFKCPCASMDDQESDSDEGNLYLS